MLENVNHIVFMSGGFGSLFNGVPQFREHSMSFVRFPVAHVVVHFLHTIGPNVHRNQAECVEAKAHQTGQKFVMSHDAMVTLLQ